MKLLLLCLLIPVSALAADKSMAVCIRLSDGVVLWNAEPRVSVDISSYITPAGCAIRVVPVTRFTRLQPTYDADDPEGRRKYYRWDGSGVVLRSPVSLDLERLQVRRGDATKRVIELKAQLTAVESVLETTTTTDLVYQRSILRSQLNSAKTTAGVP